MTPGRGRFQPNATVAASVRDLRARAAPKGRLVGVYMRRGDATSFGDTHRAKPDKRVRLVESRRKRELCARFSLPFVKHLQVLSVQESPWPVRQSIL